MRFSGRSKTLSLHAFLLSLSLVGIGAQPSLAQPDGVPLAAPTKPVQAQMTFNIKTKKTHALSLFGDVKYGPDFPHLDYVNPDAPKGGRIRLSAVGGFNSFNPYIVKGEAAEGLGYLYDTLSESAFDEPATEYGLLAKAVEVPEDYSWVTYTLRPEARFHDGEPVKPEDVIFSLNILKEKGRPIYRYYYANIVEAKKIGDNSIKFTFAEKGNRELPQITGQLPILPKHYWEGRDFERSTLEPPLGSGPYRIGAFEPNRFISLQRVDDYWAKDLPINKGRYNFDEIRYEYYLDDEVRLTAFFADEIDIRAESSSKNWATRYQNDLVTEGEIKTQYFERQTPAGMQGFFFNTRLDKFSDARVREAIGLAFNFEWANKYLFFNQYTRTNSFFDNSELAATGLPSEAELELLEPYREQLPAELFEKPFKSPATDGTGKYRKNLVRALELLKEAGWELQDGKMTKMATGETMTIEFLVVQASFERVIQPFLRDLERIGITGTIRIVGVPQYVSRVEGFDFDVITYSVGQSLSPGNEQREYWGSETASRPGSRNVAGIQSAVIDAMIEKVIYAPDRESLVTATRALDRVLLWGHYVVPQWYIGGDRYAYWNRFGFPENLPPYNPVDLTIWWAKETDEKQEEEMPGLRGRPDDDLFEEGANE